MAGGGLPPLRVQSSREVGPGTPVQNTKQRCVCFCVCVSAWVRVCACMCERQPSVLKLRFALKIYLQSKRPVWLVYTQRKVSFSSYSSDVCTYYVSLSQALIPTSAHTEVCN